MIGGKVVELVVLLRFAVRAAPDTPLSALSLKHACQLILTSGNHQDNKEYAFLSSIVPSNGELVRVLSSSRRETPHTTAEHKGSRHKQRQLATPCP